jgi:pyruvate dehydrogenase E1 component alpha subunit
VETYGIPAHWVADSDVLALWRLATESYVNIRQGSGPAFIECQTYRWKEHVGPSGDYEAGYRALEELRPWVENDQVRIIGEKLAPAEKAAIDAEVESEIAAAIDFAENSPFPHPKELYTNVYA